MVTEVRTENAEIAFSLSSMFRAVTANNHSLATSPVIRNKTSAQRKSLMSH